MKSMIFWDVTVCSPVEVHRHFRGTYRFHLQGGGVCLSSNQQGAGLAAQSSAWHVLPVAHLVGLFLDPEDGNSMFFWIICELISGCMVTHPRRRALFRENALSLIPSATKHKAGSMWPHTTLHCFLWFDKVLLQSAFVTLWHNCEDSLSLHRDS
jgi:hypothetical protein